MIILQSQFLLLAIKTLNSCIFKQIEALLTHIKAFYNLWKCDAKKEYIFIKLFCSLDILNLSNYIRFENIYF